MFVDFENDKKLILWNLFSSVDFTTLTKIISLQKFFNENFNTEWS